MNHEYLNLLPPDRVHQFRRGYFLRLAAVGVLLLSFVVLISGVLLVPTYLYFSGERVSAAADLANANARLSSTNASTVNAELASITGDASYLASLGNGPSASGSLRAVLSAPHTGIALTSITYTPPGSVKGTKNPGTMALTGTAGTREDLRSFDSELAALPFVTSANLPIDAYANVSNIDFSLTLSGTFTP